MKKKNLIDYYKKKLKYFINDSDIKRWLPNAESKIIKYSDLAKYNSLEDLLPEPIDYKIILVESELNSGHWTCIMRKNKNIECFDSYGGSIDHELHYIPNSMKKYLGEDKLYLGKLLKGHKVIYNKKKLQSDNNGIATCGRHVIARILSFLCGWTLKDFQEKLKETSEETGKPYDVIMVDWINS
jgi:hypothetical protein